MPGELSSFAEAIQRHGGSEVEVDEGLDQESIAAGALEFILESLGQYTNDQLNTIYEHVVGEVANRGLEEEILGEVPDAAGISLDEEMNEMIKLVRRMRSNLSKQTALGKAVSNREIRETLSACITATKALTSHQKSVRTLERQRTLENVLIEVLGEQSEELQREFQVRFRERLEEASQ